MRVVKADIGAVVVDSLPFSQAGTISQARGLAQHNVAAVALYLGVCNRARLDHVLQAGMAAFPVTLAGEYNDGPNDEIAQLKALGFPAGIHVFLDMEGMAAYRTDPPVLIGKIDAWADGIRAAGYKPALYVGNPQPLTSQELWKLRVELYWRGQGRTVDRFNKLAEPGGWARPGPVVDRNLDLAEPWGCGWAIDQKFPSRHLGTPSTWVDMNMVGQDYKGRVPIWAKT